MKHRRTLPGTQFSLKRSSWNWQRPHFQHRVLQIAQQCSCSKRLKYNIVPLPSAACHPSGSHAGCRRQCAAATAVTASPSSSSMRPGGLRSQPPWASFSSAARSRQQRLSPLLQVTSALPSLPPLIMWCLSRQPLTLNGDASALQAIGTTRTSWTATHSSTLKTGCPSP
jgi:hypothetical protein